MTHWAKTKERGSVKGIMFLLYVLKFLGSTVCKILLTPVLVYFFITKKAPRVNLKTYLKHLSTIDSGAPKATNFNAFKIVSNYGYGVVDRIVAWQGRLNIKQFNKHNTALYEDLIKQDRKSTRLNSSHVRISY